MDPGGSQVVFLLLPLLFGLMTALINAGHTAIVTLSDAKIKKRAEEGDKKAKKIAKLTGDAVKFLYGTEVSRGIYTILASGFFALWLRGFLTSLPQIFDPLAVAAIGVGLAAVWIVLYISLSLLIPRRLGAQYCETLSDALVGTLIFLCGLLKPLSWLAHKTALIILSVFRVDLNREAENVTEEEIMMLVDAGNEKGVINESEKQMIFNIFDFDDKTAGEVMTHRTDIAGVELTESISKVIELAMEEGYSRIPVYEEDLDDIVGALYVKDLLPLIGKCDIEGISIGDYMRPTMYVPESVRCRELFASMRDKKVQLAIVVDEYGGTSGIVTMEDLVESVMGSIQDEYDDEEEEFVSLPDGSYLIDGGAPLDDVARVLDIAFSEDTDYDTLGGLMMDLLGRIPQNGETPTVEFAGWLFTVEGVEERRIIKVKAVRKEQNPTSEDPEE